MLFNLVFDRFQNGNPYPNLASWSDITGGYNHLWRTPPFVVPIRLLYYIRDHGVETKFYHVDDTDLPSDALYPIGLAFYDFSINYFHHISDRVRDLCRLGKLKILFYYHEGDNCVRQRDDLRRKCREAGFAEHCWKFVSGNTQARRLREFIHFADHELFYWKANRQHEALAWNKEERPYHFTALNRVHKWWRATVMCDLKRLGVLDRSMWSYGDTDINDDPKDNPIEIDTLGLSHHVEEFVKHAPYRSDDMTPEQHNRHDLLVPRFHTQSYFNIVIETFFDVDGTNCAFLTEKVFKPIKHAQPFVIVGAPGSLELLRELGYRTFDHALDNSYDKIINNTQRWLAVRELISYLSKSDRRIRKVADDCKNDCLYNQALFLSNKTNRLQQLYRDIHAC